MGKPDVLDARIVAGGVTSSSWRNTATFSARRSGTASMTRSVAARSSNDDEKLRRAQAASAAERDSLSRSTARSNP